jgi:hypothetical protein
MFPAAPIRKLTAVTRADIVPVADSPVGESPVGVVETEPLQGSGVAVLTIQRSSILNRSGGCVFRF